MNSAIKQFSRPGKKSSKRHNDESGATNSSSSSSLPIEVKKFAKQMGLNLHGLEAEAEDIWEMLNKMSMNNPIEYENFIAEQLKNGKLNENKDPTTTSTDPTDSKNNGRVIRPKSGFCIVCQTTGNDGLKIRENTSNYGKNFFINFCSHEAIDVPKDRNGRPVYDDRTSADGMEIPLVIGEKRDIDENTSIAIDILVHPVVIQRCQSHNIFQSQIIDLGLQWITQECPIQFNKKYQIINDREYVGGRGVDKSTPVLFNVDEVIAKQEGKDSSSSSSSSFSSQSIENNSKGSSLLNSIKQAKFGDGTRFDSDEEEDEPSLIIVSLRISFDN